MSSSIDWPCAAIPRADLSARTTMHVGGQVEWLLEPTRPEELRGAWLRARDAGLAPRVLGGGANLIVEDGLHAGVVVSTARMTPVFRPPAAEDPLDGDAAPLDQELPTLELRDRERDPRLVAWAGAGLPRLVRAARDLGWRGLECLVGVPGTAGGGIAMNAGGRLGWMWDVVESVRVLTPDGEFVDRTRDECAPGYRDGGLGPDVCVGAVLRLEPDDPKRVADDMREYLASKNAAQPVTEWSSGCIFRNPDPELSDGRGAGKLIDDLGGKGLARGDAVVSPKHGNFIVNRGAARAEDVLGLVDDLRRLVADRAGIELETEVRVWRRD
jgi:UDP-N-acetylmuramate dehydrogenase